MYGKAKASNKLNKFDDSYKIDNKTIENKEKKNIRFSLWKIGELIFGFKIHFSLSY